MPVRRGLLMLGGLVAATLTATAGAQSLGALPAGHWMELPNTKIRSVLPTPPQQGNPAYLIEAWNGGAVDTARSRLLVWGGGHSDYWGNEIYALDLRSRSIQRIVEPSPATGQANCTPSLPDGTPTSRHTYDGLSFIAHADRFFAVNGSLAPCGFGGSDTWTYDFTRSRWQLMGTDAPTTHYGTMAVYDAATRLVYVKDTANFYAYSLETNRYTKLNTAEQFVDYHLSAALDSKRRKFVMIGDGVQVIDLATNTLSRMNTVNAPDFVTSRQSPGIGYDPAADRIVAWHGGSAVYALNMDTGVWTQVAANAGPASDAPSQGTFGRWGYVPEFGVFVLINGIDENAWVFRAATGGGTPPGNTPPTVRLTSPADGSSAAAPASLVLRADASDSDGSISKVEFYQGATLLATSTTAPYTYTWCGVAAGSYTLTARAYDNAGATTTSAAANLTVSGGGSQEWVKIADEGRDFSVSGTRIVRYGADTRWVQRSVTGNGQCTNAFFGSDPAYMVVKQCQVQSGGTQPPVNAAPAVRLTSPAADSSVVAPATVTLSADASDSDGSIARVEFYAGTTLLGTATSAPYRYHWTINTAGSYSLTARAYDNQGAVTTSTAVALTAVGSGEWVRIANEGDSFQVAGTQTVRYGVDSSWVVLNVSGTGQCTNAFFGRDPAYMVVKRCEVKRSGSTSVPGM